MRNFPDFLTINRKGSSPIRRLPHNLDDGDGQGRGPVLGTGTIWRTREDMAWAELLLLTAFTI